MMQAAAGDTSNLAEVVTAIIAAVAIVLSIFALVQARRINREINEPGWQVTVQKYHQNEEEDAFGVLSGAESGTAWILENVGNTAGRDVVVATAWRRRLQLPAAESDNLGTVEGGSTKVIVLRATFGGFQIPELTWPVVDQYETSLRYANVKPRRPMRVTWTTTTGARRTRRATVLVRDPILFRKADRPR